MDTTPAYPRPDDARIREAISHLFRIAEYISPDTPVDDAILVRALLAKGTTVSVATWAIHDLVKVGGFAPAYIKHLPDDFIPSNRVTESNPPAGLAIAPGTLHIAGDIDCLWGHLLFTPDHRKLSKIEAEFVARDADAAKKPTQRMPDNPDVLDLCKQLSERKAGTSLIAVARTFTKEPPSKCPKAQALVRQARRYPHLWKADN